MTAGERPDENEPVQVDLVVTFNISDIILNRMINGEFEMLSPQCVFLRMELEPYHLDIIDSSFPSFPFRLYSPSNLFFLNSLALSCIIYFSPNFVLTKVRN